MTNVTFETESFTYIYLVHKLERQEESICIHNLKDFKSTSSISDTIFGIKAMKLIVIIIINNFLKSTIPDASIRGISLVLFRPKGQKPKFCYLDPETSSG